MRPDVVPEAQMPADRQASLAAHKPATRSRRQASSSERNHPISLAPGAYGVHTIDRTKRPPAGTKDEQCQKNQ